MYVSRIQTLMQLTQILEFLHDWNWNVPHFKGLIALYLDSRSSKAWQHFYLLSRPLEKGHFTPKTAKCPRISVTKCMQKPRIEPTHSLAKETLNHLFVECLHAFKSHERKSCKCIGVGFRLQLFIKSEGNRHKIRRFSSECIIRRKPEGNHHKIRRKLEGNRFFINIRRKLEGNRFFFSELKNQKLFLHFHKLFLYKKVRRILEGQKVFRRKSSLRFFQVMCR